jgi:serine/threonine protein kinase/WD40 repeat protein
MTESTSLPDAGDDLLTRFQQEYESAPDRTAVLERWCGRHAELSRRLRARAKVIDALEQARPEVEGPMPSRLGEFQIVRRLGASMGEVFEAWQPALNRRVAIKTIRRGRISPQTRSRFLREQQVLAGLHQTHIVPIFAAGEEAGLQYFVMPYIDGAALHHVVQTARLWHSTASAAETPSLKLIAQRVAEEQGAGAVARAPAQDIACACVSTQAPALPSAVAANNAGPDSETALAPEYFRSVAEIMADAAEALQHAHDAGVIHRDLKPSNLMVDCQGHCWIIDFGLAGIRQETVTLSGEAATSARAALTASGVLGTPVYMAPEQWSGHADVRTDVYGLGVTLYELLTLVRAFAGADQAELMALVLMGPPAPRAIAPTVPVDLDAICRKAMHREPTQRYATPRQFADDLRRWLRGEPTAARPAWWPRRVALWARRNKGWAAALMLLLVALPLAAAAMGTIQERHREAERQNLLRQAQAHRLNARRMGWSKAGWELLGRAAAIRTDDALRNEAASALEGLDAIPATKDFDNEGACALAFDPAGARLILGAQPSGKHFVEPKKPSLPIRIWEKATDRVRETTVTGVGPVAFDPLGRPVALTRTDDGRGIVLWDLDRSKPTRELAAAGAAAGKVSEWALAANGTVAAASVAVDGAVHRIVAWDLATGKRLREFGQKDNNVLALTADGSLLAAGSKDGQVAVCNLRGEQQSVTWSAGRLSISALAFGVNLRRSPREAPWVLASGNLGGTIVLWDLADHSLRASLTGSDHDVYALDFSPDGVLLASAGRSEPRVWSVATGRLLLELSAHDYASALAFTPDGQYLASANAEAPYAGLAIRVRSLENGRGLQTFRGLSGRIEWVELSRDASLLAALSHQWDLGVWETKTGRLLHVFQPQPGLSTDNAGLAFSDDGQTLAFSTAEGAHLWNVSDGAGQQFGLSPGLIDRVAFDAESGKFLLGRVETLGGRAWPLAAKTDFREHPRVYRLWELSPQGLREIDALKDFNRSILGANFARNGSILAIEGVAEGPTGRRRVERIYSLPDRKVIWSNAFETAYFGSSTMPPTDPHGEFVYWSSYIDATPPQRSRLVHTRTLKEQAWPDLPSCLGPHAALALGPPNDPNSGGRIGLCLHRGASPEPLVTFATNRSAPHATQFNRQGTQFAWGTTDGNIILADIKTIQDKLATLHLGW